MAILNKGTTYADGDQVTSSNLNALVDSATFADGAVDGSTTQKSAAGAIIVKDLGIATDKIATSAVTTAKIADSNVTTAKIADSNVTKAKIENVANMKALGNVSGSAAAPAEVAILDEDNMASNSATSLATQQSIKAYADSKVDGTGAGSFTTLAASGDVTFDTTTLKVDSSNNRVGIGTASPDQTLVVSGVSAEIVIDDTDTTDTPHLRFRESGATSATISTDASELIFDTGTTERMRIDSSGKVGIGTNDPASMLHISGNDPQIRLVDTDTTANSRISANSSVGGLFLMADQDNDVPGSVIGFYVDGSIKATIDADGDLGIGTTNPTEKLTVSGNASITGSISKGSGSFKINHPLDSKKDTHNLVHSFLEGPQADLIYRGTVDLVDGVANVNIDTESGMTDGTFVLLCREVQSFTTNESGWTAVRSSVDGNILTIEAQDNTCTDSISWMVVGERQDQHMYEAGWTDENGKVIVEPLNPAEE